MVAPLVKDVKERIKEGVINNGTTTTLYYYRRDGYNQKKAPYVDSPMTLVVSKSVNRKAGPGLSYVGRSNSIVEATNKARKRFVDKLGSNSSFGATLTAEFRSTYGTVVGGAVKLLQAARAVRRGDLPQASQILGFSPPTVSKKVLTSRKRVKGGKYRKVYRRREYWVMPSRRYVEKSLANKWLWYSYGIKPLVSDIHNGLDVLTRPSPYELLARGTAVSQGTKSVNPWGTELQASTWRTLVRVSGHVTVINPNLWLANQLGLVNPVQMFNEGIPFSFVIDWFSNISDVIQQMTDFVGLEIARPVTSTLGFYSFTSTQLSLSQQKNNNYVDSLEYTRVLSIPSVKLRFSYERFEWQRGANAISLLVGFLKKSRS